MKAVDVAIVGGGVTGSSIAYHLARAGAQVQVFEQAVAPAVEPSASWASAGGVRQQGRDPREWPLTIEAGRRWPSLEDELGMSVEFVQGGHLHVVEQASDLPLLEARVAREAAAGMNVRVVHGLELGAIAPSLGPRVIAAAYTPDDGQAHPPTTTRAFAAAARRLGARYSTGTRVDRLTVEHGRLTGFTANAESVPARWVVLAGGAWSSRLAASVGLDLPLRTLGLQMLLTTPGPKQLAPTVTAESRQLSLKQLPGGEFFIGGGWRADVLDDDGRLSYRIREASVAGSWAVATEVVSRVGSQRIQQRWAGLEAACFDGVPLIGPVPTPAGLYLVVGFCGHGFQLAPAVGRAVADALAGASPPALAPFDPARASSFDPAAVTAFKEERRSTSDARSTPNPGAVQVER
ncbi:MAG: FAD-binding oxidoreductase [Chloroflexi bacterium]|nr:FAD-binding oxidoreductase [Chloroflexota bacterium]